MKVLWIDDEFETLEIINESAAVNDIELIGFRSAEEALQELERPEKYNAVVLDGLFYLNNADKGTPSKDTAFGKVASKLIALKEKGIILPWFILSGKTRFTLDQNSMVEALADSDFANGKVFDKKKEEEKLLWPILKKTVEAIPEYQLRQKHKRVFDVCTEKYIGSKGSADLLSILKKENIENPFENPNLYFVPIRQIMEDVFKSFNKYGFLPDVFIKSIVALDESADFLAGKIEKGYQLDGPVFPNIIANYVYNILKVCQPAAHRSEIDNFIKERNSSYTLLSVTYQTLDLLLWLKDYLDKNPDPTNNKAKYKKIDMAANANIIIGIIEQDSDNNFHCGDIVITYKIMNDNGYKVGDQIRIINPANNTKERTMNLYKYSAITTEKI
jgi:hypothetical protein